MTAESIKLLRHADLRAIFDNTFAYEDPCLLDLFWSELEDARVVGSWIDLPVYKLPEFSLFSGRTIGHQRLCAQVAAWLLAYGRGFSTTNQSLAYSGGVADVASTDGKVLAECGYTGVGKILRGLHEGFEMIVASYSFDPVLFRCAGVMHFESYLRRLEEGAQRTVELLPVALHYKDAQ